MIELKKLILLKYLEFNITPLHLGIVLRDNNITIKRTKHQHFPKTRFCLDETSIKPAMMLEYSKCKLGKRCILKTDDNNVFKKSTLLVAINNLKCIRYKLYEKGGMNKERFVDFLKDNVFNNYKNNLIFLDIAGSHNNQFVKDACNICF